MWLTRPMSCKIDQSYWMMTLVKLSKRSNNSWFVLNFCYLHRNTDTQYLHITWVSSLLASNLNITSLAIFSIPITYWSHLMDSYFLPPPQPPPSLARIISVNCLCSVVNYLFKLFSSVYSRLTYLFILVSRIPF